MTLHIEKMEDCPNGCNARFWAYDAQYCSGCGYGALKPAGWACKARAQGTPGGIDPVDCDWPFCGCDPHADKVIEAIQESDYAERVTTEFRLQNDREWKVKVDFQRRRAELAITLLEQCAASPWSVSRSDVEKRLAEIEALEADDVARCGTGGWYAAEDPEDAPPDPPDADSDEVC